ncbi:MAG: Ig-like domain-containing protein [Oscillospiraceae bacterium]|nr:Ig-like domain-containing protein [Oscillospiraceae bacterium]
MKKIISVIISFVLIFSTIPCVYGAVIGGETSDYYEPINSWRYHNGVPYNNFSLGASSKDWKKTKKGYLNDRGEVIQGATMKGIDVSQWNGDIDWGKVAKSDVDFAIIRCGHGDDYGYQDDTYFKKNVEGCIKNKIPFGVYIYSYAMNTTMAKSEANHVLRLIKGYKLSFPVYYDLEENSQTKLSKATLGKIATTFCNAISAKGYQVGIYANLYWRTNYLTDKAFSNTSWYQWVAQYNSYCDYTKKYTMWQCCSDGKVAGIQGNVDINFWYDTPRSNKYLAMDSGVILNRTSYTFKMSTSNPTMKLKATVQSDLEDKTVTWNSSDDDIATVDTKGRVTAKRKGTCYITAVANDGTGEFEMCEVTVKQLVTKVKLNKTSVSLSKKGKTYTLKATCTPTTANSRSVIWKTSKNSVATVNSKGKITAKKKGTCYITATAKDGSKISAKCKVTVKK